MIIKIYKEGCNKYELFNSIIDFIVAANEFYHKYCIFDDDYDTNYTIVSFEEARRVYEMENYTIEIIGLI